MLFQKYAPPLPNDPVLIEEAFHALYGIVRLCAHLDYKAKFPNPCIHHHNKKQETHNWQCRCCQSIRFRSIFGRYIDALYGSKELPSKITGTKIKGRAYGFRKWKRCFYFKIRRHPVEGPEYYRETEQSWCFDLDRKELALVAQCVIGEYSRLV